MKVKLEDVVRPRIEISDAGGTMEEIKRWSESLTERANELSNRHHVSPEEWQRFEDELKKVGASIQNLDGIVKANASAFTGSDSDEVILDRTRMILKREEKDDLPQMDPVYHNVIALRPDELVGVTQLGVRLSGEERMARFAGNKSLAISTELVRRVQELNDRILMKDWILGMNSANYARRGTPAERMKTLREWPEYEKRWGQLTRALGETPGSAGGFLVPVILSSQVGDMVEAQYLVARLFPRITMTSKTFEWPFKRTRSTAVHVGDNDPTDDDVTANNITASQMSFGKPVWSAQRIADLIFVADDVDEDGVESAVSLAFEDIGQVLGQAVEQGIINGEYLAATMDGATFNPAGSHRRWCNSLRFHALMTATYPAVASAGGALTFTHGLTVLEKMGAWGAGAATSDVVWITGYNGWRNLFLVNSGDTRYFETVANSGPGAALKTGQIGTFLGRPVVLSETVPLTHTDGKVNSTPANNVKGSIIAVNTRRYALGDRRGVVLDESMHVAFRKFQKAVRGSIRVDFESMDSAARVITAAVTPVGLIYNLT